MHYRLTLTPQFQDARVQNPKDLGHYNQNLKVFYLEEGQLHLAHWEAVLSSQPHYNGH